MSSSHIQAGEAFWAKLSDKEKRFWERRKAIGHAVIEALQKRGFFEQLRADSEAMKVAWQSTFGEPYPETIEDWTRLSARAGLSSERLIGGDWTPAQVEPMIEGYLLAVADRKAESEQAMQAAYVPNKGEARLIDLLRTDGGMSLVGIAERLACSERTVQRYAQRPVELDYIRKNAGRYAATPKADELSL